MDNTYHFIGIGGIGMSALARILLQRGVKVKGSDLSSSYVIEDLQKAGAQISLSHQASAISSPMTVVYNSMVSKDNPEYAAADEQKLPILHRSDLLKQLMEGSTPLLVAGTHGKTTTSALLAHTLVSSGLDPSYAIGGIVVSLQSNGGHGKGRYFVAEADESDGSFLKYPCYGGIVTSLEEEHMEYWKTKENLIEGFSQFAKNVCGPLFWCSDDPNLMLQGYSYGFSEKAALKILNWRQEGWKVVFSLSFQGKTYENIHLPLIGKHNVLNAASVFGMGLVLGLREEQIRHAFETFQGVKRRMEKKGKKRGVEIYDDYAHHPTKILATLKAVKKAVGEKRVIVCFQPHRFTRTRDLLDEFVHAFADADELILTDIFPAQEKPIEGITGRALFDKIGRGYFAPRGEMAKLLSTLLRPHDVVITMGAGDITSLGEEILANPILPYRMALIAGGKSAEHEVSISSSDSIRAAINPDYYIIERWTITKEGEWFHEGKKKDLPSVVQALLSCDVVFPMVHGPFCEDGMLQGFFETLNLPYAGPDYRAGAVTMDKAWTKRIAFTHGVEVADFLEYTAFEWEQKRDEIIREVMLKFHFPFFIKPVHLGSTIGVSKVHNKNEVEKAIDAACCLDYKFLVEEEVVGREIEFGFIGTDHLIIADPAEPMRGEIYRYEDKYGPTATHTVLKVPLPEKVYREGKRVAELVFRAMGCTGFARIDFFLKKDGTWILNEVNPIPGCTPTSVYPKLWPAEGMSMSEVIDRIVTSAFYRKRMQGLRLRAP